MSKYILCVRIKYAIYFLTYCLCSTKWSSHGVASSFNLPVYNHDLGFIRSKSMAIVLPSRWPIARVAFQYSIWILREYQALADATLASGSQSRNQPHSARFRNHQWKPPLARGKFKRIELLQKWLRMKFLIPPCLSQPNYLPSMPITMRGV